MVEGTSRVASLTYHFIENAQEQKIEPVGIRKDKFSLLLDAVAEILRWLQLPQVVAVLSELYHIIRDTFIRISEENLSNAS